MQSGEGLLSEACWDVVRQHHFPSGEQVSRLASDLRDEARQAHEDDTENRMTSWENWLRTDYRAACTWCKGVTLNKCTALIEQVWIPIFKMHELGTQPTWSQF